MAEIIWTENALESLDEVAEYIAVSSPSAASKLVVNLFEKVDRLELFPESGRLVEEVKEMGYREVIVNPCRVMYKIEGEPVFILHVIRQERDLRKYLINESSTKYE